jgi:hypothetical protein
LFFIRIISVVLSASFRRIRVEYVVGTGNRGPSEERGDHLLYFLLLVSTHFLEWCCNTFHLSLKFQAPILEVVDFREMIKSSPSGGLLSEQRPSPEADQQMHQNPGVICCSGLKLFPAAV